MYMLDNEYLSLKVTLLISIKETKHLYRLTENGKKNNGVLSQENLLTFGPHHEKTGFLHMQKTKALISCTVTLRS